MERVAQGADIAGVVRTGLGRGAGFTTLPWAARQFRELLGIDPFPGTLNLEVSAAVDPAWRALTATPGLRLQPADAGHCAARCYPVRARVAGRPPVTAAVVLPEVAAYPGRQVEVIAAVELRSLLAVADGDLVALEPVVPRPTCRAVLFDVDGTLVNSIDGYRLAAQRAVDPYGWSVSAEAVSRAMNFGDSFWDLVVPLGLSADEDLKARLRRETMAHWPDVLAQSVLVFPGVGTVLSELRAAGIRLAICTASRGESFRPLEEAGLLELFDVVVTARDVARRKPDPEGLLMCMQRLGVEAGEAVYVGDTVADVRASHAAGLFAVGVLSGAAGSDLLSAAGAHRIVPDLGGLAGALQIPRGVGGG
jgi:HAD superfamily hydrolase (TIGR01509 family)